MRFAGIIHDPLLPSLSLNSHVVQRPDERNANSSLTPAATHAAVARGQPAHVHVLLVLIKEAIDVRAFERAAAILAACTFSISSRAVAVAVALCSHSAQQQQEKQQRAESQ